ncbi:Na(+)-translocating NADH-quinone reductase subunit A [Wenzhouxiangella limi]|uniref:Na(+)-translocating NADH-quinone reductase subunit A n=1 Tax=Wenzhouxiangella limi TaxID=2707351 RepID=A0A845UXX7_9GAMM|nr:Na(+)-translocating NADH-quinone reductase subunit A [Wenzhouxiangella limi]NDY94720.1 Na(+)-translocating NADH-quinone reductase subunit A [Wenzhouxiangella limi]
MIRIRKGLELPLSGPPEQRIEPGSAVRSVAVLGGDYPGMRPTLHVAEGDRVRRGQLLFEDKKNPGVRYTAPAAGRIQAIHRGEKRFMQSVVIEPGDGGDEDFSAFRPGSAARLAPEAVRALLIESGEWTALRTRPFGQVPAIDSVPAAIFVRVIDTHPLAPDPAVIVESELQAFEKGLKVLQALTDGPVWVCRPPHSGLPSFSGERVREEVFAGPHPAGNPGTHIHYLCPVGRGRVVWSIDYQDVIAFGHLFATGKRYTRRVIALAGPRVKRPRLVETRLGASVEDLCRDELVEGSNRIISGSVFNGHHARGPLAWLSRWSNQITVVREDRDRRLFGYLSPGLERHSALNIYLSRLRPGRRLDLTTTTNGSERAMVPLGQYETVMPLDILPTQLLRSLVVGDLEMAEALGALELVEEDLALCAYVCVGKYEYGPILRDVLEQIQKEG